MPSSRDLGDGTLALVQSSHLESSSRDIELSISRWYLSSIMRTNKFTRKTKALSFAALLVVSSSIASANPVISSWSENSLRIDSAGVVRAIGGGSYVTGMIEPSFGYFVPRAAQVRVAAYGASGKLLAEKVDEINTNDLVISHFNPTPRAPDEVFLPWEPSRIAKVTVIEYSGHTPPA
jgi:hypothetical protein